MPSAGVHYLDAIFSALRDASAKLEEAERWLSRLEALEHRSPSERSFEPSLLKAARDAHEQSQAHLNLLDQELAALGREDHLPILLAPLPARSKTLRKNLEESENRLVQVALKLKPRTGTQALS